MAIPSGDIYLFKNVPLTAAYEHTIDFKDASEQFSYFHSLIKHSLSNYTYIRKEREYISAELPITVLDDINYLAFQSSEDDRLYYGFVTNKRYVNEETTEIYYTIDVLQTYMFDYEWRASFIKQAHVDRWDADFKPIYSYTDEGLDYGTEYSVESAQRITQSSNIKWLLVSTVSYASMIESGMNVEFSKIFPAPPPFATFLVPIATGYEGGTANEIEAISVVHNGGEIQIAATYIDLIDLMLNSGFGEYVKSISLLTYNPLVASETESAGHYTIYFRDSVTIGTVQFGHGDNKPYIVATLADRALTMGAQVLARDEWNVGIEDAIPTESTWAEIKSKPRTTKRDKRFESKLLCAPYRYNLLTDWRSNPVVYKNEYIAPDKIEVDFSYALSYNAPFRYWLKGYKHDPEGRYTTLSQPIALEFPIISDAYYTYMLQNKNTIQANLTNAIISAASTAVSGAISGGGMGGVGGAIFGGVTGAISGGLNVQAQIRSETAKQRDLHAKPDALISQTDSAFNINDNSTDLMFYRMKICCVNEEIIAEIFNMNGYKVNRLDIPNTRSRVRFNYIQTLGANIVGSINQADLLKIREIYDRGVTIWHYSQEDFHPLDYSYENIEVNLI